MSTSAHSELLTPHEVAQLVDTHFPQVHAGGKHLLIESIGHRVARVRMLADETQIRPGGTVSGPSMFKLADFAMWAALLGSLGEHALQAVTTSMTMNFLLRPRPADMIAHVRIIKLGRRLAVGEIELYSEGAEDMVAHATATYAIPPENMR
jgi:uncharacterized protein (TIGR00369 family)